MTDFLPQFLETALSIGLTALVAGWAAKHFTLASAKHVGFAVALGVALGRGQTSISTSELERAGAGLGGMLTLAVLWFFWFKRPATEDANG